MNRKNPKEKQLKRYLIKKKEQKKGEEAFVGTDFI